MKTITVPTKEQVSPESQILFEQLEKHLGKVPNLYATIGYSPQALKGLLDLEATVTAHSAFTGKEREAINLIVSQVNACDYCLAAHTAMALKRGFSKEDTLAIRRGQVNDPKLNVLVQLSQSIAENKGKADGTRKERFFEAGYTEAALMELVALITVRTFTNYAFALTEIPIDFPAAEPLN
ncbi:carboxymuconolactone decarboxylase family protein [Siphonobacter sp.]|uniref:carboxymuconolactone decarboxylase family protein n=1 Tax=Siphonobacter sp. TaxID=1869184 RepID=UPI003B3AC573